MSPMLSRLALMVVNAIATAPPNPPRRTHTFLLLCHGLGLRSASIFGSFAAAAAVAAAVTTGAIGDDVCYLIPALLANDQGPIVELHRASRCHVVAAGLRRPTETNEPFSHSSSVKSIDDCASQTAT
uniref:Putative secreted protein n=1 Tax=Anopheles triannulatus TaxID=58253 RepID=A0A2M4B4S0_9DIPT